MSSDGGDTRATRQQRNRKRAGAVTMAAVARHAGVSAMTVSNVINNKASVQPATRKAVQKAVAELDYRPNPAAQALASASLKRIGLMHWDGDSALLSAMLTGTLQATARLGVQLALRQFSPGGGVDEALEFSRTGLDGLLLPPPLCEHFAEAGLGRTVGVPVVALAPGSATREIPAIRIDDVAAAHALTTHLIRHGHRRIAFVQLSGSSVGGTRLAGYRAALRDVGLEADPTLIWPGRATFNDGLRLAELHLGGPLKFSAVMAGNDDMAAAFVNTALRQGMKLPDELSITGFDDTPIASKIWPGLTTVSQPLALIAQQATELLIAMMRNPDAPWPEVAPVPFELVMRASVAKFPAKAN